MSPEAHPETSQHAGSHLVDGRYEILLNEPLPHLNVGLSKAYALKDNLKPQASLYAAILPRAMPYRSMLLEHGESLKHPSIVAPIASAIHDISTVSEARKVLIFEQPPGKTLAQIIGPERRITQKAMIQRVILPLTNAIRAMEERGIAHGAISPERIFLDDQSDEACMLGECFSELPGYSQSLYYEPIYRAMCNPTGKGEATSSDDYFALGVLTLFLLMGKLPAMSHGESVFMRERLISGSFIAHTEGQSFSPLIDDLLRGLLNDNPTDRWGYDQIRACLRGQSFNLPHPHFTREAARPFPFQDVQYFTRLSLANALHQNWKDSRIMLRDDKLIRWIELSANKQEVGQALREVVAITGGENARRTTDDDELVSRSIIVLDPQGPIRMRDLVFHFSALGPMIAEGFRSNDPTLLKRVLWMIENDYHSYWSSLNGGSYPGVGTSQVFDNLQQVRNLGMQRATGFGVERYLYEMNDQLPCQSPLLVHYHADSLERLLWALDRASQDKNARANPPIDEHIAAFISARMEWRKPPKAEFGPLDSSKEREMLLCLLYLARVQNKVGGTNLSGLGNWIAARLRPVLESIHNRQKQKELQDQLQALGEQGKLEAILTLLCDRNTHALDHQGFAKARARYRKLSDKIKMLNDLQRIGDRAQRIGGRVSLAIAYSTLLIMTLNFLRNIMMVGSWINKLSGN